MLPDSACSKAPPKNTTAPYRSFLKTADPWYSMRSDLARNRKKNNNNRQIY